MADETITRIQQDLLQARKDRDQLTADTLRSALARITNAEAVPAPTNLNGTVGVGATEVARRDLSNKDIQALLQAELAELRQALDDLSAYPNHPYAVELTKKIAILERYTR